MTDDTSEISKLFVFIYNPRKSTINSLHPLKSKMTFNFDPTQEFIESVEKEAHNILTQQ